MKLIIGNKSVSSWSLRPWVLMKHLQIPFEEILIKLDLPDTTAEIKKFSPSGKVPALVDGTDVIWESVAIMEYLHELFPEKNIYPKQPLLRARARSLVLEMHGGFSQMRDLLSFNIKKRHTNFDVSSAQNDITRMNQLLEDQLRRSKGPFLFGEFSIADAMYAPIPFRYQTYGVEVSGVLRDYFEMMLNLPAMKEWHEDAMAETFVAALHP